MSLKEMIEFWKKGVDEAQQGRHSEAIKSFLDMPEPGARIYFNIANMYVCLGNIEEAEKSLNVCVKKDPNLAIGYFQRGCLHIVNKKYREAICDFDLAIKNLRGNLLIDYKQLGLIYKLYTAEVLYNKAYCLWQINERSESKRLLNEALASAAECSESRHRVVSTALDQIKRGEDFLPYRLPKTAQVFVPPRSKTDVVNNIDFLGKAKVVSSVVDQDDFTGFVGAQKNKESRSPSPAVRKDLPPHSSITRSKSSEPPPKPNPPTTRKYSPPSAKDAKMRPPKPSMAPPSFRHPSRSPNLSPSSEHSPTNSRSPSPYGASAMTIKVHYTTTRAIRVASSISYQKLVHLICRKFDKSDNSITLWFKCSDTGDRIQLTDEKTLVSALIIPLTESASSIINLLIYYCLD
uniref:Uncharacterized protein n=1 Tax=Amphimedon queenslandica TaxID=400682 RepID=A0A1X7TTC9_AMPQE